MVDDDARAAALGAIWQAGRAAWPDLALDEATFVAWLDARIEPGIDPTVLSASDLYLAAACLHAVPNAARRFIEGPLAQVRHHIERIARQDGDGEAAGELQQQLAVLLLTPGPDGAEPRLAQYTGRGALTVWLRMAAVRRALNARRTSRRTVSLEDAALDQVVEQDIDLTLLRRKHRDAISAIFQESIAAIAPDQRTLLRMHYVEGVTLAALAAIHRTSRSSLHRRIEQIRDDLVTRMSELASRRLQLSGGEHHSLLRLFKTDLHDALGAFLARSKAGGT